MSKNVKLTMTQFGKMIVFMHGSVKSAASAACADVKTNEAAPVSIEENGVLIWKNTGPFDDSYDKLRELAELE